MSQQVVPRFFLSLDLQGQLSAGGDLTLWAQDTVQVREELTTPFVAVAVGNLTIEGHNGIDILALSPLSPGGFAFQSGGNLSLISDGIISGDARFSSGGSFLIKSVSGGLANMVSYYDPIISAEGDVDVAANYTGTSLLVEATGNIRFQGDINITGPDTSTLPPGPDTATLSTTSALIMRSGQTTLAYGGVNSSGVPNYGTGAVPEGITIGGNVVVQPFNGVGGIVNLLAASGNVSTKLISTKGQQTYNDDNDANGGAISISAQDGSITTGNFYSYSYSQSGTAGQGGEISLIATSGNISGIGNQSTALNSFSISEQGTAGNGGNVALEAKNNVSNLEILTLSSSSQSGTVQVTGLGDLLLTNTNILTSRRVTVQHPFDPDRVITLNVDGRGQSGDVAVTSLGNLTFFNSSIQSDTKGSDPAGNVTISSPGLVSFTNSRIISNTSSQGAAGSIDIEAGQGITLVGSNSQLFAGTTNQGKAGDITLTTPQLTLQNGASIATTTVGSGNSGTITVNAATSVQVSNHSRLSVEATAGGTAGNLSIQAGQVSVQDGGEITVSSTSGQAGNLNITANSLSLNQGKLTAETGASGTEGANINLSGLELLLMQNESLISAKASDQANGGNISLDTKLLLTLLAVGSDGSDIIASAEQGNGGRITINADAILGIRERKAIPGNRTNDIDASSELGTAGEVQLNTLADPSRGLSKLPEQLVDPTRQLARECAPRGREGKNEFIITGRGGLPPNPRQVLRSRAVEVDWVTLDASANNPTEDVQNRGTQRRVSGEQDSQTADNVNARPHEIVEAQGWVIDDNGKIALVATPPTTTPHSSWQKLADCHTVESPK